MIRLHTPPERLRRSFARAFRGARTGRSLLVAGILSLGGGGVALGQSTTELLTTALPYPAYQPVRDDHYLIRYGRLGMRLDASIRTFYSDNARIVSSGQSGEFSVGPLLTAGFFLPVSKYQKLQLDVGIGYDYFSGRNSRFRLNIVPNSHLDYGFRVGDVDIRCFVDSSTTSDSTSRIEVAGGSGAGVEFRQLDNRAGVRASYGVSPRMSLFGGYSYNITRTLTDSFTQLDRNTHAMNAGTKWQLSSPLSVGLAASYSMFEYVQRIQNDGKSMSIGPTFEWKPADPWVIEGSVSMTQTTFERTGTIQDDSDSLVPTFELSVGYLMNREMTHRLHFARTVNPGLGSNFTDQISADYRFSYRLGPKISPFVGFTYADTLSAIGLGENPTTYAFTAGVGYPILRKLYGGLDFQHRIRKSDTSALSFTENRVSMNLSYSF